MVSFGSVLTGNSYHLRVKLVLFVFLSNHYLGCTVFNTNNLNCVLVRLAVIFVYIFSNIFCGIDFAKLFLCSLFYQGRFFKVNQGDFMAYVGGYRKKKNVKKRNLKTQRELNRQPYSIKKTFDSKNLIRLFRKKYIFNKQTLNSHHLEFCLHYRYFAAYTVNLTLALFFIGYFL